MENRKFSESVTGGMNEWIECCLKAGKCDEFFRIFRRSKIFLQVTEVTSRAGGLWNLRKLLFQNPTKLAKVLPLVEKSDYYGSPPNLIEFRMKGVEDRSFFLNPTTIRYLNNAFNVNNLFSFENIDRVFEIGGGYGGECKVFNDFSNSLIARSLKWTIFDLPSSFDLISRYLSCFSYSTQFSELCKYNNGIDSNSLVLSNGALSEMRGSTLKNYIDKVVLKCKFGYFITNFESHSAPFENGWTTNQFIDYLYFNGKHDVKELDSNIFLSPFDHTVGTKLVVFGTMNNVVSSDLDQKLLNEIRQLELVENILYSHQSKFLSCL
jgi:hypothetical protein